MPTIGNTPERLVAAGIRMAEDANREILLKAGFTQLEQIVLALRQFGVRRSDIVHFVKRALA